MDLSYLKGKGAVAPNQKQETLPDGKYKVFVHEFMNYTTKAGKDAVQVTFKILEGEHKGERIWYYLQLPTPQDATEQAITNIQKFIYMFDPNCQDGEQFFNPGTYHKYLDKQFEVTLKTNNNGGKSYQNCYINKAIEQKPVNNQSNMSYDPFAE